MLRLALLASLPVLARSPVVSADCAFVGLSAKALTPSGAVPADGGILVAAVPDEAGKLDPGDAALKAPWRFKNVAVNPSWRSLAPGLAVMVVPTKATELIDTTGKLVLTVKATDAKPTTVLGAPKISAVTLEPMHSRRQSERITVSFDDVPAGAVAIVLSDTKGKPRTWKLIEATKPTSGRPAKPIVLPIYGAGRCTSMPNGTLPSKAGEAVVVQFVDQFGRLSPASRSIKVTGTP